MHDLLILKQSWVNVCKPSGSFVDDACDALATHVNLYNISCPFFWFPFTEEHFQIYFRTQNLSISLFDSSFRPPIVAAILLPNKLTPKLLTALYNHSSHTADRGIYEGKTAIGWILEKKPIYLKQVREQAVNACPAIAARMQGLEMSITKFNFWHLGI